MTDSSGAPRIKITYATLRADNEELHAAFEEGVVAARARLGQSHANIIDGEERAGESEFELRSPIDQDILVGRFARGTREDVRDAIAAARAAQPAWNALGWEKRVEIMTRAGDIISERLMEYGALMAIEVGKNRMEALGEVEESADLIRYYARIAVENEFYQKPMDNLGDPATHTRSVLRPHGVFGVIAPFNFPLALAAGPVAGALVAGNTCVFKPASTGAMSGVVLMEALRDAGMPNGVCNMVMGPGSVVGDELASSEAIDGIVFTGSYEVGMGLQRGFTKSYPRPCIIEMGGKNPAIVMSSADLDKAAEGIMRAAFGFGGQKCSANSRVYVDRSVHDELVQRLVEQTEQLTLGDPLLRENWLGPVTDRRAVDRFEQAVAEARRDGAVYTGGEVLTDGDMARGFYVEPTVVGNLPADHRLFRDELFVPFTAVCPVDSLDEALTLSNAVVYGLTAGIYSEVPEEVEQFLDEIHTGVLYVNRRAGATTGAWPGVQPFGGWKGSGSTGKAALGPYYVAQFLREQSHTIVD
ncbi:MAG: aldehyde dehydrogenase family protein [Chloroflexota bacterium]|nr:aldehyde dehydrogenase family protein [Chloroflexota bacterium]